MHIWTINKFVHFTKKILASRYVVHSRKPNFTESSEVKKAHGGPMMAQCQLLNSAWFYTYWTFSGHFQKAALEEIGVLTPYKQGISRQVWVSGSFMRDLNNSARRRMYMQIVAGHANGQRAGNPEEPLHHMDALDMGSLCPDSRASLISNLE